MQHSYRIDFFVAGLLLVGAMLLLGCAPQLDGAAGPASAAPQSVRSAQPLLSNALPATPTPTERPQPSATASPLPTRKPTETATPSPTPTPTPDPKEPMVVGTSVGGRPIESYRIGQGPLKVVFAGGIHGGYEWNTILLAYRALDYFRSQPEAVPAEVSLFIIPNANPDGLYAVAFKTGRFMAADVIDETLLGRFNAHGVDLNRNWDCDWQPMALWGDQPVYGGDEPFSEPESQALSQYLLDLQPAVAVFLHSAAEGVYAAGCPETDFRSYALAAVYGVASGYPINEGFAHYDISGDAGDWLTTQGIPSFTVELTNHQDLDWDQNLAGMLALLAKFKALAEPGLVE